VVFLVTLALGVTRFLAAGRFDATLFLVALALEEGLLLVALAFEAGRFLVALAFEAGRFLVALALEAVFLLLTDVLAILISPNSTFLIVRQTSFSTALLKHYTTHFEATLPLIDSLTAAHNFFSPLSFAFLQTKPLFRLYPAGYGLQC